MEVPAANRGEFESHPGLLERMEYEQLEKALGQLGISQDAAEYHGGICGAVCARVGADFLDDSGDERVRVMTERLRTECSEELSDPESGFQPLLPDDDAALADRVDALAIWCSGFLSGLAGLESRLGEASEEIREITRDLTEISRAEPPEEGGQEEEEAYAELVEYVRVGVQMIFLEFHASSRDSQRTLQ